MESTQDLIQRKFSDAEKSLQNGDVEGAIGLFNQVLGLNAANIEALSGKGDAYVKLGRMEQALLWQQMAANMSPTIPALMAIATTNCRLGLHDVALEYLEQALQQDSGNLEVRNLMAICEHQLGNTEKSAEHFQLVLKSQPDNILANACLAMSLCSAGEVVKSLEIWKQQIESKHQSEIPLDFYFATTLATQGLASSNQSWLLEALRYVDIELASQPRDFDTLSLKCQLLDALEMESDETEALLDSVTKELMGEELGL